MSGVWKRSYGRPTETPPDERGGNRHGRPNTTAPHPDSTGTSSLRAPIDAERPHLRNTIEIYKPSLTQSRTPARDRKELDACAARLIGQGQLLQKAFRLF